MISNWGIDWGRFIDIDIRRYDGTPIQNLRRLQFAYRIDTSVCEPAFDSAGDRGQKA
jgi:hypothetical protein